VTSTALLVHGAFADSGSWAGTIRAAPRLDLLAVPDPLRGLAGDAASVAASATMIDGPVVLVGHGYAGAVISVAAVAAGNVVGLVYIAGFVPDETQSCVDILLGGDSAEFLAALRPYPVAGGTELYLDRTAYLEVFAGGLDPEVAAVAAATQRPVLAAALEERPAAVAWRDLPCWYLVATADRMLPARTQHAMAARAGATTAGVPASHAVPLSHPEAVAELIGAALL
jgi:pimeloyl-ACP methyl ester carboxylesterase